MKIMFKQFIKKKYKKYKIYKKYKQNNQNFDFIHELLIDFQNYKNFNFKINKPKNFSSSDVDTLVKQFTISNIFGQLSTWDFYWQVAEFKSNNNYKVVLPAPFNILKYINSKNIRVNYFFSISKFFLIKFKYFIRAFFFGLKILVTSLANSNSSISNVPYVYVFNINKDAIPNNEKDFNYLNWIKYYLSDNKKIIQNNFKLQTNKDFNIQYHNYIFPSPIGISCFLSFLIYYLKNIIVCFFKIFHINNIDNFFLKDIFQDKLIDLCSDSKLADKYFFNNVSRNYRPIWTFNNKINNKVNFIFYGLNEFPISFYNSKNTLNNVGWDLMNWPSYVSWNKSFTNYLHKSFTKPFTYNIFDEPVWYRDSSDEMDLSFKSNGLITIALYDVSPVRKSLNYPWTKRSSYINSSKNVIKFYTDILSLQIKYKFNILIKTKKNHGYKTDKNYAFFIKKIAKSSNMIFITSQNKSPKLINKEVNAIISYPFTSAAYFNDKNIPSIYYDPTASIDINKQINFGVSTINRISDLEKWILKIIN